MKSTIDRYFAFGSNLSLDQMRDRCPGAEFLAPASLQGYRLVFNVYSSRWGGGAANIVPAEGEQVWGLLYSMTPHDIRALDGFEGHPTVYERTPVSVESEQRSVTAWTYIASATEKNHPPPRRYMDIILQAAAEYQFPSAYTGMLVQVHVVEDPT